MKSIETCIPQYQLDDGTSRTTGTVPVSSDENKQTQASRVAYRNCRLQNDKVNPGLVMPVLSQQRKVLDRFHGSPFPPLRLTIQGGDLNSENFQIIWVSLVTLISGPRLGNIRDTCL